MYNIYKLEEKPNCPHCGAEQEYQADDYIAIGAQGAIATKEDCHDCYKKIHFISVTVGLVRVSRAKAGLLVNSN